MHREKVSQGKHPLGNHLRENIHLETNKIKYWKQQVDRTIDIFVADLTTNEQNNPVNNAATILEVAEAMIHNHPKPCMRRRSAAILANWRG